MLYSPVDACTDGWYPRGKESERVPVDATRDGELESLALRSRSRKAQSQSAEETSL